MKKTILTILCFFCSLLLIGCSNEINTTKNSITKEQAIENKKFTKYEKEVENFNKVSSKELLVDKGNEGKFIYVGRKTCKYCRKFVPKIKNVFEQKNIELNYLDTESLSEDSKKQIINKYQLTGVPSLIFINKENKTVLYNEDEIRLDVWVEKQLES